MSAQLTPEQCVFRHNDLKYRNPLYGKTKKERQRYERALYESYLERQRELENECKKIVMKVTIEFVEN